MMPEWPASIGRDTAEFLGVPWEQARELFYPETQTADWAALEGEEGFISRETAASVVRRLADTGEVDWDA